MTGRATHQEIRRLTEELEELWTDLVGFDGVGPVTTSNLLEIQPGSADWGRPWEIHGLIHTEIGGTKKQAQATLHEWVRILSALADVLGRSAREERGGCGSQGPGPSVPELGISNDRCD